MNIDAEWIAQAVSTVEAGIACRLEKDNVTVYAAGSEAIRIDIKRYAWAKEGQRGWIPCRERRPVWEDTVLFTVQIGDKIPLVEVGRRVDSKRLWRGRTTGRKFLDCEVTAWMPLPDAYIPPEGEEEKA